MLVEICIGKECCKWPRTTKKGLPGYPFALPKEVDMRIIFASISLIVCLSAYGQIAELPEPSGDHAIGTKYLSFVDRSRPEPFTLDTDDHREITVKAWYPTEPKEDAEPAPHLLNAEEVVQIFGLPPSYASIRTHSYLNLPVLQEGTPFPVLIFNHGWGEHFSQSTVLMEELASHGYIVFSIGHHYEAKFSFYPDGRYIAFDPNNPSKRFRKIMEEQSNPEALRLFEQMFAAQNDEERELVIRKTNEMLHTMIVEGSQLWADDIIFFIDQLEVFNKDDETFSGSMDLSKIGVFGVSMGGIASGQVCIRDERIKCGVNMDGGILGHVYDSSISQPFMFVSSIRYRGYESIFLDRLTGPGIAMTITNSDHHNFVDASIFDTSYSLLGEIDGRRMLAILNEYTLAFFDRFLRGVGSQTMQFGSPRYTEINAIRNSIWMDMGSQ